MKLETSLEIPTIKAAIEIEVKAICWRWFRFRRQVQIEIPGGKRVWLREGDRLKTSADFEVKQERV